MAELILHHFQASPFSEKIRRVLGYKGLAWKSVLVPLTLPKPDVQALTGGYRRTPLLQIGADIYCDTALICDVLEHVQPTPTLYPAPHQETPGRPKFAGPPRGAGWAQPGPGGAHEGLARIVAQWADSTLFWAAIAGPRVPEHRWGGGPSESADAFNADRNAMFSGLPKLRPADAAAARKSYLRRLSDMLQHQPYLLGDAPSIADFAASAPLWFSRVSEPASADFLQPVPALIGWMERLQAFGQGRSQPLASAQAIVAAAATEPSAPGHGHVSDSTFQDEHGIELGSLVSIRAESFGLEASTGRLIAATRTHYSIERRDPRAGTLHVHFPRIGYVLERAAA